MFLKTMGFSIGKEIINNVFNWKIVLRPVTLKHKISINFLSPFGSRQRRDLNSGLTTIYQAIPLDCISPIHLQLL